MPFPIHKNVYSYKFNLREKNYILTKEYFCQKHGHTCIDKIVLKIVRAYGFSERHPLSLNTDLSLETRHLALSGDD